MTFATAAIEASSERFILVKMAPRRYLGPGTSIGSNNYTYELTLDRVDVVTVNETIIDPANWTYVAGTLTINTVFDLTSLTNFVVVDHYVFLTGSKIRDTTAGVSGLPSEIWDPYIIRYPNFTQSIRNISEGVFSISSTELEVFSYDRWIQKTLSTSDSWFETPVTVWMCIDSTSNNRVVFNGLVSSLQVKSNGCIFSLSDGFQKLNKTATFGDSASAFIRNNSTYTTYVQPQDEGQPIPLIIGKTSPLFIENGYRISETIGTPATTNMYRLYDGLRCMPVSNNIESSSSVTFLCGRIVGTDIKKLTFGTISASYAHVLYNETYFTYYDGVNTQNVTFYIESTLIYLQCSNFNGEIGDYIPNIYGGLDGFVCRKSTFNHLGTDYNVAVSTMSYSSSNVTAATASGAIAAPALTDNVYPSMSLWIEGTAPANFEPTYIPLALNPLTTLIKYSGRYVPFTLSLGTASSVGGETITHIYATVSSADIGGDLPGKQSIKCRFSPNTEVSHARALEFVCASAGLDIDSTSFSQADIDLVTNVVMSSPAFSSSGYSSYLDVAQSILKSTFGVLKINTDRDVEYQLISDPDVAVSIGQRNETNMVESTTNAHVEYQDIYSKFLFENPQYKGIEALSGTGPAALAYVPKAFYLHKVDRTKIIQHVLDDISVRSERISSYGSEPVIEYNFSTSSEDLISNLGDVVDIDNSVTPDSVTDTTGMIVGLDVQGTRTNVKVNTLRGL